MAWPQGTETGDGEVATNAWGLIFGTNQLKQIRALYDQGLIDTNTYEQKVQEILKSL